MAENELGELVRFLRTGNARTNVGLWLVPPSLVGQEPDMAVRLSIAAHDAVSYYRSTLDPRAEHARLSASSLFDMLDGLAGSDLQSDCVLVYNMDLLLARLSKEDRDSVWRDLYSRFPNRRCGFVIAIPQHARSSLPADEMLRLWRESGRLA